MRKLYVASFVCFIVHFAAIQSSHACKSDADCKGDRVCEADKCVSPQVAAAAAPAGPTPCSQDKDCRGDDVCERNVCVGPGGAPPMSAAPAQAPASPAAGAAYAPAGSPAPVAPTTVTTQPSPPPAGLPAASAKIEPTYYKSFGVLIPRGGGDLYGVSGIMEQRIGSTAGSTAPSGLSPTIGFAYEALFYTGDLDYTAFTQAMALTLGFRSADAKTFAIAARAGLLGLATTFDGGGTKSTTFDGGLLLGGDLALGYLVVGVEGWVKDGSLWMLRAGFGW